MSGIKELFLVTKELHDHLQTSLPKDDGRDVFIETINELLAKRQQLINEYSGNLAEQERPLAEQIVAWNKKINERLQLYMSIIKVDINKLKQQKQTGQKYENPYDNIGDGIFFDKKN